MSLILKIFGNYQFNQDAQHMVVHCILKHCRAKRLDPNQFVAQTANLDFIAELVHKEIKWGIRMFIDRSEVKTIIEQNIQHIQQHIYDASH